MEDTGRDEETMTGKQRFYDYLGGERVDRVPNFNIAIHFAAKHAGIPFGLFCSDYRKIVEANLKTSRDFHFDVLNLMCDPYREVADFGGKFTYSEDRMPQYVQPFLERIEDISRLKPFEPTRAKRSLDRLEAIALAKKLAGDEYVIYGEIDGPLAVSVLLRGMANFFLDMMDEPEFVRDIFEIVTEVNIRTIKAQKQAGAEMIVMGEAAASQISAQMYRDLVLEYDKRVIDAIKQEGMIPRIHICGNNTHLLPFFPQLGVKIVDLDWMVDIDRARNLFPDDVFISGNLDPVRVYLQGDAELVREKVLALLQKKDRRIIVSSGCEIAQDAVPENVYTQYLILKEHSSLVFDQ